MKSMWVPAIICGFCIQNRDFWTRITNLYGSQTWPVVLCMQNSVISTWKTSLLWVPALMCGFWMQNSDLWTRITSLYGSQTSPVLLCMQNIVICTRISSLYRFQPSAVVFACKTATSGPDLQVCMGRRPHLWFWAHITACLAQEYIDCIGSSSLLWYCAFKTATLGLELQVSVGPRPHLWFLHEKQRLVDQNNKCLWVPEMTCRFVHVQQRA